MQKTNTKQKHLVLISTRNLLQMRQSDVAKLLGISTNAYSKKENCCSQFLERDIDIILEVFNKKLKLNGMEEMSYENLFKKGVLKQ